ncbi:MAG: peptidylprolyl isomerase [Clostridia bacterium]|nr:peptidylprolyl isomerase [Clostridia bacterium]
MKKRALLALLLAAMMLLSSCALIVKDEEVDNAREIIRLGDIVYTKADVEAQVQNELEYMQLIYTYYYGQTVDITDPERIAEAQEYVVSALTEQAVMSAKIKELGLDQLTEEEQATLETTIQETIELYAGQEGVTEEAIRTSELNTLLNEKLYDYVVASAEVTEEEYTAAFNTRVEEAKTEYAADLSAYGADVLNGYTVYYRPAGYRNVKQILIAFSEEDSALIDEIDAALYNVTTEQNTYTTELALAEVTNIAELVDMVTVEIEPATAPTATVNVLSVTPAFTQELSEEVQTSVVNLAEAEAKRAFLEEQLAAAQAQARANIDPKADEVLSRLAAGEDWDALAAEYNEDPGMMEGATHAATGYPVCEGFTQFDSAFVDAAMALSEVGSWTDKTEGSYGYYIIQYTSDVAEGAVDAESVRTVLMDELLATEQGELYDATLTEWVETSDVKVDRDALND